MTKHKDPMIITHIEEGTFKNGYYIYDGFTIHLDDGNKILMGISNSQNCCENWGYLISNDHLDDFIGSELLDVKIVGEDLAHVNFEGAYFGDTMFINIETSKGTLQFVAYNEHNGYYSHDAVLVDRGKFSIHAHL